MATTACFDIRNFTDRLTPAKGSNRYICPVCGGNNLTIDPNSTKYKCWSGCECRDIREAIAPWDEVKGNNTNRTRVSRKRKKSRSPAPAPIPDEIQLARLPELTTARPSPEKPHWIPKEAIEKAAKASNVDTIREIRYWYSETQWVSRFQWEDSSNPKGYDKTFRQGHIKPDGSSKWNKGKNSWLPYRFDEVLAQASGKWVMLLEGEECVEFSREIQLVAITLQGSSWSSKSIENALGDLKNAEVAGVIFPRDNDDVGVEKAKKVSAAAAKLKFPCLVVEPTKLWENMPHKGDLVDWVKWGTSQGMNAEDFIRRLEEEIHAAVDARIEESPRELSKADLLRLEIKAYLQTDDIVERSILRGQICSTYRLSAKSFNAIAQSLDTQSEKPLARLLNPEQFMSLETGGGAWLIPGRIPATGVFVLAGNAGVGKTTLAYDAAAAVIYGEEFLGESTTKQGSVLFVASDELPAFGQDKLINRDIQDNYHFLLDWDVSQWSELEEAIEATHPALVIVDSFNAIQSAPDFDENSALASQSVKKLEKLSNKYSVPVLLIHHLNKSKENKGVNRVRGSSAIAASCSAIAILEGEGTVKRFHQPKIRGSEPLDLRIEMNPETGIFKVLQGNCTDAATKSLSDQLLAFFNANPDKRFEMAEIAAQFPGIDRDSLYKALNRLVKRGLISKRPSQINWRSKCWGLAHSVTVSEKPSSPDIEKKYNPPSSDIAKKQGGLPPPIGRDRVSNDKDETIAQKDFPSLDISLDTHWTSIGHDNDCPTMKSSQGASLESLDIDAPQKGGEGVSDHLDNENETQESPQSVTGINTHSTDSVNSQQSTNEFAVRSSQLGVSTPESVEQSQNSPNPNSNPNYELRAPSGGTKSTTNYELADNCSLVTDYSTYPHLTSSDIRASKKRASAILSRMLSCTNYEQLAAFCSEGEFSETEINWVYCHLLNDAQKDKVREAAHSVQLTLFDALADNSSNVPFVLDWDDLIAATESELSRLGWSTEQAVDYLKETYGYSSRQLLSDEQILDFICSLRAMP